MKPQILIVDDHQMARRELKFFLEQNGYTCEEADNGQAALTHLEAGHAVDLIISDNQMPVMTGMELLTKIKIHPNLSSIPVILYSGNVAEELYTRARQAGVYSILTKPFNFKGLLATMKEVVPIE